MRVHVRYAKIKNAVVNLMLLLASTLAVVLATELALRLVWQHPGRYAGATDESLFWQYDSLLGWSMQPNARGEFVRPEFRTAVATNRLGLRDDELPAAKGDNEVRILLLGDSVVAGFEVEKDSTLEARLEQRLARCDSARVYQVINAGFRGYGTDQELLFLQHRGLALQPDVVVLAVVPANDPENNVTVHTAGRVFAKPYFVYDERGKLVLRGVPVPKQPPSRQIYSPVLTGRPPDWTPEPEEKPASPLAGAKAWLSRHLYLYAFIAQRLKAAPPQWVAWLQRKGILHSNVPSAWVDVYRNPMPPEWQKRWQLTLDLIAEIHQLCQERGIRLLVWMFPLKEQIYARDREIFLRTYGLNNDEIDFDWPERLLHDFCERKGIEFVATLAPFRRAAQSGRRLHFISDNHFNAAGHALIAELLFDRLCQQAAEAAGRPNGKNWFMADSLQQGQP